METFKILQHIEKSGIDNSMYNAFTMPEIGTGIDFVRRYFGGDFLVGWLESGQHYVAFWSEEDRPAGIPDAIVTDTDGAKIYIYHAE